MMMCVVLAARGNYTQMYGARLEWAGNIDRVVAKVLREGRQSSPVTQHE